MWTLLLLVAQNRGLLSGHCFSGALGGRPKMILTESLNANRQNGQLPRMFVFEFVLELRTNRTDGLLGKRSAPAFRAARIFPTIVTRLRRNEFSTTCRRLG